MEINQSTNLSDNLIPLSSKLPCIQSTIHIFPGSVRFTDSHLHFTYSTLSFTTFTCKFFVYEDGLGFIPDNKYLVPDIIIESEPCQNYRGSFRLDPEYTYEFSTSLPIVIEANTGDMIEITIIEVRNGLAKVIQQRIVKNKKLFELKEIINPPAEDMDERDKCCVICMTNNRNAIMEPCCHICICDECANLMRTQVNRKCPMCRAGKFYVEVISFMKINF